MAVPHGTNGRKNTDSRCRGIVVASVLGPSGTHFHLIDTDHVERPCNCCPAPRLRIQKSRGTARLIDGRESPFTFVLICIQAAVSGSSQPGQEVLPCTFNPICSSTAAARKRSISIAAC